MSRITDIITRARDTLADPSGQRWSDSRLLRLISEAQQDIAKQTQLFKAQTTLTMVAGQRTYALPSDVWVITRASVAGRVLQLVTHEQLDAMERKQATRPNSTRQDSSFDFDNDYIDNSWETDTSVTVEALIYDKRNLNEISVYPIPSEDIAETAYTIEMENGPDYVGGEYYGVTTAIDDYTSNSDYGVVTELFEPGIQESFSSNNGVVTSITESDLHVNLWYILIPEHVTELTDKLLLPSMWDTAVKHYVVGNAFDDDYDTRYAEKSQKAFAMYDRELGVSKEFKNNVRNTTRKVAYRGAFD